MLGLQVYYVKSTHVYKELSELSLGERSGFGQMTTTTGYNLPAEIVPTVAIAGAGVAVSFFALLEISKDILAKRKHVMTRLLPLTVANLISTSWFSGIIWLQYTDQSYSLMIWVNNFLGIARFVYFGLDGFIYYERVDSIFVLHEMWRKATMVFLGTKFILQMIPNTWIFILETKVRSRQDFASLTETRIFQVQLLCDAILPTIQAIVIDVPIMLLLIKTIRRTGSETGATPKRIIRIFLLIFLDIVALITTLVFPPLTSASGFSIAYVWGLGPALATFVNLDLYMYDVKSFQHRTSQYTTGG